MSWLKYVGGALAGVGAVVALPVAGPVGAITALGAVAGASLGATGASMIGSESKDEAKAALIEERGRKSTEKQKLDESQLYFDCAISYFAVGICAANIDGRIDESEMDAIQAFITGMSEMLQDGLPKDVKNRIEKLTERPPNIIEALVMVKNAWDEPNWDEVRELLYAVISADKFLTEEEATLLGAFENYIEAA
ncbi:hypothetical protein AB4302_08345 [Vibrio breoganii]